MASLWNDFRFGLRRLKRRRGFSAVAVTTVSIGLAIAASLFAVIDGVLLRPLPFRDSSRLVALWQTIPAWKNRPDIAVAWDSIPFSIPEYDALSTDREAFEGIAIWSEDRLSLKTDGGVDYVRVTKASWTMAKLLGLSLVAGRYFSPDEDRPNAPPVVLVTSETWRGRYGGDSHIVGRTIDLDHTPYVVIGVLPPGLTLDRQQDARSESSGGTAFSEYWLPARRDSGDVYDAGRKDYHLLARLNAGVSIAWAAQVAHRSLHTLSQGSETTGLRIEQWQAEQTRSARTPLLILGASACFLLLIACANVALLTLGEAAGRQQEIAVRVAVGASRRQLMRQLATESVVICVAGATLALPLSVLTTKLLLAMAPLQLAAIADIQPDVRVLLFGFAATTLSAIIASAAPSSFLLRLAPAAVVNASGQRTTGSRGRTLQQFMIGLQTAMATALLIGASLLFRTFEEVARVHPGFNPENLLVAQLILPTEIWSDTLRARLTYADLFAALAGAPEVSGASGTSEPPIVSTPSTTSFSLRSDARTTRRNIQYRAVVPGYFRTMEIRLLTGRDFTSADRSGTEPVAIVSSALAQHEFANQSPIGQQVQLLGRWRTVIGVVDDIHFARLSEAVAPTIYLPFLQLPGTQLDLVVRTHHDPARVEAAVRKIIYQHAPTVGIQRVDVMASAIRRSFAEERYRAALMVTFSVIATFLALISAYGVTLRSVRNRNREAAIRLSLGASNAAVMSLMMGSAIVGLAFGAAAGVVIAGVAERWLRPYLFHVSSTDPRLYATILFTLTLLVLGTNWFAVRGISDLDLATALRAENE